LARSLVSYDRMVAETEAWPLSSRAAYELGTVRLAQSSPGYLTPDTEKLAGGLEKWLRPRARGLTLEVLRQIRDNAWLSPAEQVVPLADYLVRLARRYIELQGNRVGLRPGLAIGSSERAARWRWLSYLLPEDLLTAAIAVTEGVEPAGEQVHLSTPHLEKILNEQDLAETHLHVGAAVPFPLLWAALLGSLADNPPREQELERGGPPPFGSGKAYLGKLLEAATARLVMASFLEEQEQGRQETGFEPFCYDREGGLARVAFRLAWHKTSTVHEEILHILARLGWKQGVSELPLCLTIYRKLLSPRSEACRSRSDSAELACLDPLSAWLKPAPGKALPETRFATRALAYLCNHGKSDRLFERIFWQYQRVRCSTFRHLVEEPGTGGLDWFGRHYQRISAMRKKLDGSIYRCALESESTNVRLGALEARLAPPETWPEVYSEVCKLAKQAIEFARNGKQGAHTALPEVALIFHFIKEREDRSSKRLHADPGPAGVFGCRFGRWFHQRLQQAYAIECALERDPEILLLLRGLDVANAELAVPMWACLPLFERVRQASIRAAERLSRRWPEWQASPLQITCHLGEDFVRLIQGLRRIHEPIEFGLLATGSRIGHAVALGLDPSEWSTNCATLPQTAEERLDDLLWELDRYGRGDIAPSAMGRLEYARREVVRLGQQIYARRCNSDDLLKVRKLLHSPVALAELGYPFLRQPKWYPEGMEEAFTLLWSYLSDRRVFERGQEMEEVQAGHLEVAFLRSAQQWLRRQLGRLEITIESNPSSNLLIGELRSLEEHPAFRLLPLPSTREPEESPLMLSVNVDDPVTFASHLANEYAHIYFALIRREVPSQEALTWLGQVRDYGWRSRFTLRASRRRSNLRRFSFPSLAGL
jgi:hypothetical protein